MGHPQVVSQLVRHRGGYLNQLVPGIRIGRNTTRGTKRTDGIYISFSQNVIVKLLATWKRLRNTDGCR